MPSLPVPFRRRRERAELARKLEDAALQKALGAVAQTLLAEDAVGNGLVRKSFLAGNAAQMPTGSWYNASGPGGQAALVARLTQNLAQSFQRAPEELEAALAQQGLSWGPPFPPGRPLDPFWGYRRPPRTWDFPVGVNVQLAPRFGRISFNTIKALYDHYDTFQVLVRHLINDVRSLDYQFVPPQNTQEDATEDIERAEAWLRSPDKRQPFRAWLGEYLQDVLRYDAGALYIRRNEAGEPIALEVVSGPTIIPLVDFYGRLAMDEDEGGPNAIPEGLWPGDVTPAYLQIIEGMPWVWLAAEDMIYQPLNPLPESQYGLAPIEAVLLSANTDVRFQWHFLQYFTEGTIPAGFMQAPPDMSDPAQIAEWQETWDAVMLGDQAKLRQIRWVPAGSKYDPVKDNSFDKFENFPLYLMRRMCAAFGVVPNDIGYTEDVNRSVGEVQVDIQWRIGTLPLVRHVEDVINLFLAEHLKLKARIQFDVGREVEDRVKTAQAEDIYIKAGVLSADEVRMRLGKRISRERPTPRFIDNTRAGPIPLLALESLGGKVDATTYGPAKDQPLIDHPFISAPGVAPVMGSKEHQAAQNATANMQSNMLLENVDDRAPGYVLRPSGHVQTEPGLPEPVSTGGGGEPPAPAGGNGAAKGYGDDDGDSDTILDDAFRIIDALLDRLGVEKVTGDGFGPAVPDNTGGPGVTRGLTDPLSVVPDGGYGADDDVPTTINAGMALDVEAGMQANRPKGFGTEDDEEDDEELPDVGKTTTAGVTVATGIEGNPLTGATDKGDEEDEAEKAAFAKAVRQWRENARNRLRKGARPRRFEDPALPQEVADLVWEKLQHAVSMEQVNAAFAPVRNDPASAVQKRALELLRPEIDALVASANRVDAARDALLAKAAQPAEIHVNVEPAIPPDVHLNVEAPKAPDVHLNVEAPKAPDVQVQVDPVSVQVEAPKVPEVHVHQKAPKAPKVTVEAPKAPDVHVNVEAPKPQSMEGLTAKRNRDGSVTIERKDDG